MMNIEIESVSAFLQAVKTQKIVKNQAFQVVDISAYEDVLLEKKFENCVFLGCEMSLTAQKKLLDEGNMLFPKMELPFECYRNKLYNSATLYDNFVWKKPATYKLTTDHRTYEYYVEHGKAEPDTIQNSLAQRLHDHSITDSLDDYLSHWESHKVVAIMGGHSLSRTAEDYRKIVLIAKDLAEKGHLMVSGGGPGGMEATHLGAWLAFREDKDVDAAIAILAKAPLYNDELWLSSAFEVMERFPLQTVVESIGIPTWFYGHEPPTPFATHIAKYFANSVREEGLLAIAKGGVIFAPGSAGTVQEIFQEAAQNHYETFGNVSPMVFLNKEYWQEKKPVYPVLQQLAQGYKYADLLAIADEVSEITQTIRNFTEK